MGAKTVEKEEGIDSSQQAWVGSEGLAGVAASKEGNADPDFCWRKSGKQGSEAKAIDRRF